MYLTGWNQHSCLGAKEACWVSSTQSPGNKSEIGMDVREKGDKAFAFYYRNVYGERRAGHGGKEKNIVSSWRISPRDSVLNSSVKCHHLHRYWWFLLLGFFLFLKESMTDTSRIVHRHFWFLGFGKIKSKL